MNLNVDSNSTSKLLFRRSWLRTITIYFILSLNIDTLIENHNY